MVNVYLNWEDSKEKLTDSTYASELSLDQGRCVCPEAMIQTVTVVSQKSAEKQGGKWDVIFKYYTIYIAKLG